MYCYQHQIRLHGAGRPKTRSTRYGALDRFDEPKPDAERPVVFGNETVSPAKGGPGSGWARAYRTPTNCQSAKAIAKQTTEPASTLPDRQPPPTPATPASEKKIQP